MCEASSLARMTTAAATWSAGPAGPVGGRGGVPGQDAPGSGALVRRTGSLVGVLSGQLLLQQPAARAQVGDGRAGRNGVNPVAHGGESGGPGFRQRVQATSLGTATEKSTKAAAKANAPTSLSPNVIPGACSSGTPQLAPDGPALA